MKNKYVHLEKISDDAFGGLHPNGIDVGYVLKGWVQEEPVIGEQLYLFTHKEGGWLNAWTSKVKSVEGDVLKTQNSTYKITIHAD